MNSNTCYNTGNGSYQKWYIGNDIRAILMANEEVSKLVGTKIFPLVAAEGTEGEFIVYERARYSKTATKMGVVQDECTIILSAIADDYDTAIQIASAIDNALTGKHTKDDGTPIMMVLADSTEAFSDGKFIELLTFNIK